MVDPGRARGQERVAGGGGRRAARLDKGSGGAWSHRMRRGARHWRPRQRQSFQQSARRSGGGYQLLEGATRRDLHLYGRTPELDRAWTRAGGAAEGYQAQSEEEAGGDLIIPLFFSRRSLSRPLHHIANWRPAILPRLASKRSPPPPAPCLGWAPASG